MSSESTLQSTLTSLQQNDYVTLAILTVVGYDYVLTFPKEIEYIWTRPWTWVSTLFVLVRYFGFYVLVVSRLSKIIIIIRGWAFLLFLGAADFMMTLRVWAMYHRSKLILRILLTSFSLEIVSVILASAIHSDPNNMLATTSQTLNFSICIVEPTSFVWSALITITQLTHGAAMCILAIAQFLRQSLQMYRFTKQWQLNQYMSLLVKQGIFYFFAIFVFSLLNVLAASGILPTTGWQVILSLILEFVPMFTLTPRFIMSIRELYARDVQGRHAKGIDTGFGLSSSGVGETPMMFADVELDEGVEIPMEVMTRPEQIATVRHFSP